MEEPPKGGHTYAFGECLGRGAFGSVFKARDLISGDDCAVKIIRKTEFSGNVEAIFKEVGIISGLKHPGIVEFRQVTELEDHILIEMELMSGGTLRSRMENFCLTDCQSARILREVLEAVVYLHSHDIVHRDLKPENILFKTRDVDSRVKVTDFGLSAKFEGTMWSKSLTATCGTLAFMAPEQAASRHYERPVDVWSCGIIMYMMIAGQHPLLSSNESNETYIPKLMSPTWVFPSDFPSLAKDLFMRMVSFHPLDRYTAEEALRHPWVTRDNAAIPKTYIERLNDYNSKVRLFAVFIKACGLAVVVSPRNNDIAEGYRSKLNNVGKSCSVKVKPKVVILEVEDVGVPGKRVRKGSILKVQSSIFSPISSPLTTNRTSHVLTTSSSTFGRLGVSPVQSPTKTRTHSPSTKQTSRSTPQPTHRFFS